MPTKLSSLFLLPLTLLLQLPAWSKEKINTPPTVKILSPAGGLTQTRAIWVKGTISDPSIQRAIAVINGIAQEFDVKNGRFQYYVLLAPGENLIQVIAQNSAGVGHDNLCLYASVPKRDIKIVLNWDTKADIDLHVIDPNKEHCYYSHMTTKAGGKLDRDDTDGFGPEIFRQSNAIPGEYKVKVKYYGGTTGQTRVKVTIILFEGTPKEERKQFFRVLSKAGELAPVCSFYVNLR